MTPQQVWQAALGDLERTIKPASFQTFIKNTSAVAEDGDTFTIAASTTFAKEWLDTRLRPQIEATLGQIIGRRPTLAVVVEGIADPPAPRPPARRKQPPPEQAPLIDAPVMGQRNGRAAGAADGRGDELDEGGRGWEDEPEDADGERTAGRRRGGTAGTGRGRAAQGVDDADDPAGPLPPASTSSRRRRAPEPQSLRYPSGEPWRPDDRWTFASFIVGPSNRFAHAAAKAVADAPATAYNPLFIHGGVGLGKTHLLHAIAGAAAAGGLSVLYVTCEQFTNDIIDAIQRRQTDELRAAYRSADVLLVDDIQFLAGKESTQEEFFHTFNHLHGARRQIVISSDRPPRAIATLEQRLTSRFEWGLIVDVQPPDLETRTAILRERAQGIRPPVPAEVLDLLAQRVQRNVRELEGALTTVVAYARLNDLPLTLETAAKALSAVARHYAVEPKLLRGKQRDREIVVPRQVAMYLMREETAASLLEIGRELGGRDHSTVLHGWEKIKTEVEADDQLRRDVLAIRERLFSEAFG